MKKFLALLLALCMMLALVACGDDEGGNDKPTSTPGGNTPAGSLGDFLGSEELAEFAAGFGIADPTALMKLFLGPNTESIDIKDLEVMGATDGTVGFGSFSGNLFGKKYAINAFVDQAAIIWNAPGLTDKAIGITFDDLMALLESIMNDAMGGEMDNEMVGGDFVTSLDEEDFMGGDTMAEKPAQGGMATAPAAILAMIATLDVDAVVELLDKYYDALLTELQTNTGLTVEDNGTALRFNGTIDADDMAAVFGSLLHDLMSDDEFWAVAEPLLGVTKEQATAGMPDKDTLIAEIAQDLTSGMDMSIRVTDLIVQDGTPLVGKIRFNFTNTEFVCEAEISFTEDTFGLSIEVTAGDVQLAQVVLNKTKLSVKFNDGQNQHELVIQSTSTGAELFYTDGTDHYQGELKVTDNGISLSFKQNEQTLVAFSLVIGDDKLTITLNMGGQEMVAVLEDTGSKLVGTLTVAGTELGKVVFGKKVSGSRYTVTFESLTVQGQKLDFADAGIYFFIDKNPNIPNAPTQYESVADWTQEDLQNFVMQIMQNNPTLFEKLFGEQM